VDPAQRLARSVHPAAPRGQLTSSPSRSSVGSPRPRGNGPRTVSIAADAADRAALLTRLFIEALNARDLDALASIVSEDAEFRNAFGGRTLRGREAVERIVRAAADARLRLVRVGVEEIRITDGLARVTVPVLELVGGAEIEGRAEFEVRDGAITAFEVSSELLRR
jgi:ketosteroid isomerase-like protein